MRGRQLKEKMARDEYVYGTHVIGLVNPLVPEYIARAGMDFAFICMEHMPLGRSEASAMCKQYAALDVCPVVRIPYPDARIATIAVEGGAEGIVAPYVEKPSEFADIINALKYRPIKGKFLQEIAAGTRKPADKLARYMEQLNENLFFIAGVESVHAIENLDAILATEGVCGIFLGPHDISCSLEIPCEYENPLFIQTVCDVIRRCRKAGKPVGVHTQVVAPAARPFLEAGANLIIDGADATTAARVIKEEFDIVRSEYEGRRP